MPRTCRPHGTPGNGGSNWTTPSPATTSASAVLLQARKVRSLAKVQRGSGSVPSSDLPGSVTGALPWLLVMIAAEIFAKKRWRRRVVALLHTGARGPRAVPESGHQGTTTIPALSASLPGAAGSSGGLPRVATADPPRGGGG